MSLSVKKNETVLEAALSKGLQLPHDCKARNWHTRRDSQHEFRLKFRRWGSA